MVDPMEQAALDLLNCGPTSVAVLGGAIVARGLMSKERTIGHAYFEARSALERLVVTKRAKMWPDGECYTLPDAAVFETRKSP